MADIYPEIKNLFRGAGRKSLYTPEQLCDEFAAYIEDLKSNPIEVESDYKRQDGEGGKSMQRRTNKYPRPPKVYDFVTRWLGMTRQWWYSLTKGANGELYRDVVDGISLYIRNVKYDGAIIGIYNPAIVIRELGREDSEETDSCDGLQKAIKKKKEQMVYKRKLRVKIKEITDLLTEQGTYTPGYSAQVKVTAGLFVRTEMLAEQIFSEGHKPINVEISREGNERESISPLETLYLNYNQICQRALQALGMNTDSKERKPETDTFNDFLEEFKRDD